MEAEEFGKSLVIYVGTRKIVAMEGSVAGAEAQVLRWKREENSEGFKNGFVSNLERASVTVQKLVDHFYGSEWPQDLAAYVVLGNAQLKTCSFSSSQYYQGDHRTVSPHEIRSVIHQTRTVATLPLSEWILQAFPESFLVNDLAEVRNPLGLEARRLGVNLKIFTMNFQDFRNLEKVTEVADLEVRGFFPKTLTVSEAVLTPEEKQQGVLVVDLADDATHLVLWKNGSLAGTRAIPQGGKDLSQRIAAHWGLEPHDGERLKEEYGNLNIDNKFTEELVPLMDRHGVKNHPVRRCEFQDEFIQITYDWLTRILTQADHFAAENKINYPHFVFTGGGAKLDGLIEFLQRRFSRVARIGLAKKVEAPHEILSDPSMTGVLGMFRWLAENDREYKMMVQPTNVIHRTFASARDWFLSYF